VSEKAHLAGLTSKLFMAQKALLSYASRFIVAGDLCIYAMSGGQGPDSKVHFHITRESDYDSNSGGVKIGVPAVVYLVIVNESTMTNVRSFQFQ